MMKKLILAIFMALCMFSNAFAGDDDICTDRPSKSSSPCVVPEGHFQLETDLYNWGSDGTRLFTNPTLKYGLGHDLDIELNMIPYETTTKHKYGTGDLYIKLKYEVYNGKDIQAALFPYIKIPTATPGIGNSFVEGGIPIPVQFNNLPWDFTINIVPEIDVLRNPNGNSYYGSFQNVISLNHSIFTDRVVGAIEVWQQIPLGLNVPQQYSLDFSILWMVTPHFQLDAGINFGLNNATPKQQIYGGFSVLF